MNKNTVKRITFVYEDGSTADFEFDDLQKRPLIPLNIHVVHSVFDAYSEAGYIYLSDGLINDWLGYFVEEGLIDKGAAKCWRFDHAIEK